MPAPPQQLGDLGARVDLLLRQGTTFGPVRVQLKQPGAQPVDLTGAQLMGGVRRRMTDQQTLMPFEIVMDDPEEGMFHFGLSAAQTLLLGRQDRGFDQIKMVWEMRLRDAAGFVRPLFWGEVNVHLGVSDGG